MTANDVVELYRLLSRRGIDVWLDGGWGVDALLGRQTRPHADLDIALRHSDVPALRQLLIGLGYRDKPRDDTRDCNFVMRDSAGREIDIHSFELDAQGNNVFGVAYCAEHLTGLGQVLDCSVRCVPPEWMVKFHTGYPLDADDFGDVKALCDAFGIELPEEHRAYWERQARKR